MTNTMYEVVAIIPARGGSKGLPRKNILPLGDKPLIAYSIESALSCDLIDRVVVSTDDHEVAEISREYGAEVPFMRPPELSGDKAQLGDVLQHAVTTLYQERFSGIIRLSLLPTHPFRATTTLTDIVEAMLGDYWTASTVRRLPFNKHSHYTCNDDGSLTPLADTLGSEMNENGQYYYRGYGLVSAHKHSKKGWGKAYFKVIDDPISLIDIDTMEDFRLAEKVLELNLFDFKG